jgi:cytochrome c2
MLDTMTLTKATGAVCGSLLVFLLGSWAAEAIYSVGGGHGEDHAQGYVIDTGEEETEEVEDTGPDLPALFASADASKGERVFNQCRACHMLEDGQNGVGPHLYGVVAREIGSVEGYNYSGALSEAADVWTAENLYAFLENPAGWAPGTSMGYSGLSKPEDRANLIAYLDQTDGTDDIEISASGPEAPTEEAPAEEAPAEEAAAEEATMDDAAMEEEATEEVAQAEGAPEEDVQEATSDESASEEAATATAAADESASDDGTTEMAAADDAATEDEGAAEETAAEASGFAAMVASADIDAGKQTFRQCSACHAVEPGRNMVGPSMHGVVGREIASVEGFRYSDALSGLEGDWTPEELSAWLENPRDYAPGNRMGYPGLKDEQDRANVIAYIDSLDD